MRSFGQLLRLYRRQGKDALRGGLLTQERLGELLGQELGDAGYSGAAVSDWEHDKSKIHQDNRLVLVKLLVVLHRQGGFHSLEEANELLLAGNYRPLDGGEQGQIFPELAAEAISLEPATPAPLEASAQPATLLPERRKQLLLLDKVKQFWVEGVLEKSLADGQLLALTVERYDEGVEHPWNKVVGAAYQNNLESFGQNMVESFQAADRALLILGMPGSGKTTSLIGLARHFISLAEAEPTYPIPVILNLSSWAEERGKLADWMVEELTAKYQIPRRLGRSWLENDELVLLLDGLDQMPAGYRAACVSAINQFRETHGLTGLVVCCRLEAYKALPVRLKLGGAILLCPLTAGQIDGYLAEQNPKVSGLRTAVQQDALLQEIAQSPLMLAVMSQVYQEAPDVDRFVHSIHESTVSHHLLFEQYIQRMFQRRAAHPDYPAEQTRSQLSWLAQKMSEHNQTVLLIGDMQPSWLPTRAWHWFYLISSRLMNGLFIGFFMWLFWLLIQQAGFTLNWVSDIVERLPFSPLYGELFVLLFLNAVLGMVVGILDLFYYQRQPAAADKRWHLTAVTSVVTGLLGTLVLLPLVEPLLSLSFGLVAAVSFGLTAHYIHGRSLRDDIRTVEALSWSWRGAAQGLLIGLLLFLVTEWLEFQLRGPSPIARSFLVEAVPFFLAGGLRGKRTATTSRPNEAIWLSAGNAMITAVLLGLSFGIMGGFLWNPTYGVIGGILVALIASSLYGGGNVLNHLYLRFLLWYKGWIPWQMARFLNYGVDCVLLHRVGGGYIFIHPLFQDYFSAHVNSGQ